MNYNLSSQPYIPKTIEDFIISKPPIPIPMNDFYLEGEEILKQKLDELYETKLKPVFEQHRKNCQEIVDEYNKNEAENREMEIEAHKLFAQANEMRIIAKELRIQSDELKTQSNELKTQSNELKTQSNELHTKSNELKTQSSELKTQSNELKTQSSELHTQSKEKKIEALKGLQEVSEEKRILLTKQFYSIFHGKNILPTEKVNEVFNEYLMDGSLTVEKNLGRNYSKLNSMNSVIKYLEHNPSITKLNFNVLKAEINDIPTLAQYLLKSTVTLIGISDAIPSQAKESLSKAVQERNGKLKIQYLK